MKKFWLGISALLLLTLGIAVTGCSDGSSGKGSSDNAKSKTITSLRVATEDGVTTFSKGSVFSNFGIVVTVVYSDNTTKDVSSSAKFLYDNKEIENVPSTAGEYTITVKYSTVSATYKITVLDYEITLTNDEYTKGDGVKFDSTTISIKDGQNQEVSDYSFRVLKYNEETSDWDSYDCSQELEVGSYAVRISINDAEIGFVNFTVWNVQAYSVAIGTDAAYPMTLSSVKVNDEEQLEEAQTITTAWSDGYKVSDLLADEGWTVAFTFTMTAVGTNNWDDFNWEIRENNTDTNGETGYWGGRYDNYMVGWLTGYHEFGNWGIDNLVEADNVAYGGHWYGVGTNTLKYDHSETLNKTCVLTFTKKAYGIKVSLASEGTEVWSCLNDSTTFEKSLTDIKIDTDDVDKVFTTGSEFNSTNLKVTAVYDNETQADVSSEAVVTSPDMSSSGEKEVTVSYTEGSVTKTKTYPVTISDTVSLKSIELDTSSVTKIFAKDGTFSSDGLVVTATYTDNSTKSVAGTVDSTAVVMGTPGVYMVKVSYTEEEVTKEASYTVTVQAPLDFTVAGTVAANTAVPPLAVTESTGVSVSFWLGSDYTSDVAFLFTTSTAKIGAAIDYYTNGVWTNGMYPGESGTVGTDFSSVTYPHTIFLNDPSYVTISFNTDKSISYYKNGKLAVTYATTATFTNNATDAAEKTAADVCAAFIAETASKGLSLNPNNFAITNAVVSSAKDDTAAANAFNDAVESIISISVDTANAKTEYLQNGEFTTSGLVVTATDSNGSFVIPLSFVEVTGGTTAAVATSVTVTVTLKDKTSVTTNYTISVTSADSVNVPTAVYYNTLKADDDDLTIVGSGAFVSDDTFGTVFKNDGTAQRTSYLKLPEDTLQHSATSKEMTIGFWVSNTTTDAVIYHPLFSAYHAAPANNTNTSPMFILQSRGIAQVNCAGWCDFEAAQNDNGANAESISWLGAQSTWHYYTSVITETSLKIYADGTLLNSWTIDGTTNGQVASGLFANAGDTALSYVCLGGNQAWSWGDTDAPYSFAKFAVWDSALTAAQINKIVSTTKNSDADSFAGE